MVEDDDDLVVAPPLSEDKCPRCLEFLPFHVRRCPQCGQPITNAHGLTRTLVVIAALMGIVLLCIVLYGSVYANPVSEAPPAEEQGPEGTFAAPPETSAGHEVPPPEKTSDKPPEPPAPEKVPPLNR